MTYLIIGARALCKEGRMHAVYFFPSRWHEGSSFFQQRP